MPKQINSRRFLNLVRKAINPLELGHFNTTVAANRRLIVEEEPQDAHLIGGGATGTGLFQLDSLSTDALFEEIKTQLKHSLPSERCLASDMITAFINAKRLAQMKSGQINELLRLMAILLMDRAEKVRFLMIDALCYLSSIADSMCDTMISNKHLIRSIMLMLEAYFLPIVWSATRVQDKSLKLHLYTNTFSLLTTLCAMSSKAIKLVLSSTTKWYEIFEKSFETLEYLRMTNNNNLSTASNIANGNGGESDISSSSTSMPQKQEPFCFVPIAVGAAQLLAVIHDDSSHHHHNHQLHNIQTLITAVQATLSSVSTWKDSTIFGTILYLRSLITTLDGHRWMVVTSACGGGDKKDSNQLCEQNEFFNQLHSLVQNCFAECSQQLANAQKQLLQAIEDDLSSEMNKLQAMHSVYQQIKHCYLAKRCTLELLTNLLSGNEEENEYDDDEENEEMEIEAMTCDDEDDDANNDYDHQSQEMTTDNDDESDNTNNGSNVNVQVKKFCSQLSLMQLLANELLQWNLFLPTKAKQSFVDHVYGKDVLCTLNSMILAMLTLVHNLIATKVVTTTDQSLTQVRQLCYELAFKPVQVVEKDLLLCEQLVELREEAINVMREYLSTFNDFTPSLSDLESLLSFIQHNTETIGSYTKMNYVRIIAMVASKFITTCLNNGGSASSSSSSYDTTIHVVASITNQLLNGYMQMDQSASSNNTPSTSTDLVLHAEILDALIDIYSDDNEITIELMKKLDLITKLRQIGAQFKKEVSSQRAIARQNAVVSTVATNFQPFIVYKQKVIHN